MVPEPLPQPVAIPEDVVALDGRSRRDGAGSPVVALRELTRTYGSDPPVHALRSVDLTIRAGEWMAIVGPSGSGKSTLLNVLGCLDRPTSGSYFIEGIDAAGLTDDERAALRAQLIGFVFQTFHLLSHRTALENVMLAEVYSEASARADQRVRSRRSSASGWRAGATSCRRSSPAVSSSASRSRGRSSGHRGCCSATSPPGNLDSVNTDFAALALRRAREPGPDARRDHPRRGRRRPTRGEWCGSSTGRSPR